MHPFSCVLALVLLLSGPSLAGSVDHDLPGIGTFSYNGSPVVTLAPSVMAAMNLQILSRLFRQAGATKQFSPATKPFPG